MIGTGQLGSQFAVDFHKLVTVFGYPVVDITRPETFEVIRALKPKVIINCAAYTNVIGAETDKTNADAINAEGPGNLARLAKELDALLVHVSTDYVFDGLKGAPYGEDDPTHPLNYYGESKLHGEQVVQQSSCRFLIARTAWLYGQQGPNFVLKMIKAAENTGEIKAVTDKIGSPTFTKDLAAMIWALIEAKQEGIFHCVNEGEVSRYGFASEIIRLSRLKTKVGQAKSTDFPSTAVLPDNTALSVSKLRQYYQPRSWQKALEDYMNELQTKKSSEPI